MLWNDSKRVSSCYQFHYNSFKPINSCFPPYHDFFCLLSLKIKKNMKNSSFSCFGETLKSSALRKRTSDCLQDADTGDSFYESERNIKTSKLKATPYKHYHSFLFPHESTISDQSDLRISFKVTELNMLCSAVLESRARESTLPCRACSRVHRERQMRWPL